MPDADALAPAAESAAPDTGPRPPRRWWHPRRLLRGRLRPVVAAAVAGVLAGAGVTAWQSGTGPFSAAGNQCWDGFGEPELKALFGGSEDVTAAELPIWQDKRGFDGPTGTCRLTTAGSDLVARLYTLDTTYAGTGRWAEEFLGPRLTPLGGGLLGMASDTRAWLALPEGCLGAPDEFEGPTVVDVVQGRHDPGDDVDTGRRAAMARAVVRMVNHVLADQGCGGTVPDPVRGLPAPPSHIDEEPGALCGVKGLRLPGKREYDEYRPMVTRGEGPVRTCDRGLSSRPGLRLMTVSDPRLAEIFDNLARDGGTKLRNPRGYGALRPDLGIFQAECQTGKVTFLVKADDADRADDVAALLPPFVAAEATRVGCGPIRVTLP
ncbi:hypothetical protein ACFVT5_38575 [Streptomyces sp. NPDC058001]|uniref:hypothetical protein n=1 Tax=Streptomyces sp. NPDC058001 TaxID=3346300 RepID=UPI0036EECE94